MHFWRTVKVLGYMEEQTLSEGVVSGIGDSRIYFAGAFMFVLLRAFSKVFNPFSKICELRRFHFVKHITPLVTNTFERAYIFPPP